MPVGIRVPTPCASLPVSLAWEWVNYAPSLPFRRAGSSINLPIAGSTADPAKREASAVELGKILEDGVVLCLLSICAAYTYRYDAVGISVGMGWHKVGRVVGGRMEFGLGLGSG